MFTFNNVCSGGASYPDGYSPIPSGSTNSTDSKRPEYFVAGLNKSPFACDPRLTPDDKSIYVGEDEAHYFFRMGGEQVSIDKIDVSQNEDGSFNFEGNIHNVDEEI